MHKKYDNVTFNFQQKNYIQKMIFIYFDTILKMTIIPRKFWPPNTFIWIFLTET